MIFRITNRYDFVPIFFSFKKSMLIERNSQLNDKNNTLKKQKKNIDRDSNQSLSLQINRNEK